MVNILLYWITLSLFFRTFENNLHLARLFILYLKLRTTIVTVTVQLKKSGNATLIQYYYLTSRAYSTFIISPAMCSITPCTWVSCLSYLLYLEPLLSSPWSPWGWRVWSAWSPSALSVPPFGLFAGPCDEIRVRRWFPGCKWDAASLSVYHVRPHRVSISLLLVT